MVKRTSGNNAMRHFVLYSSVVTLVLLGGCVAPLGPTAVQRFHIMDQAEAPAQSRIAVIAADGFDGTSLEFRTYAAAVADQLTRQGYTVVNSTEQPDHIATLAYNARSERVANPAGPFNVGIGGGTGGFRSGVGGGVGVNLGGGSSERVFTRMEVVIKRVSDNQNVWEAVGTSEAKPGTADAEVSVAAAKLADAMFLDFPGESGETIEIK